MKIFMEKNKMTYQKKNKIDSKLVGDPADERRSEQKR